MAIKSLEKVLDVNEEEIPEELKQLSSWVMWCTKWLTKQQAYSKVPFSTNGYGAKTDNSKTWDSFDKVNAEYVVSDKFNGIGFVLSKDDDYVCLDIDNAVNPDTGQLETDLALEMTELTYCELSPSGTGLHCFFKGELPEGCKNRNRDLDIEIYDNARFITMTGHTIGQSEIVEDQEIINNLMERYFKKEKLTNGVFRNEPKNDVELSDEEVINMMLKSKKGKKISDLLKGDWELHFPNDSSSEAVASLLFYLAFYTGKNREQMERIFTNYNQLTDKWDRPQSGTTWGQLEVDSAIKNQADIHNIYKENFDEFDVILNDTQRVKDLLNKLGKEEREYMEQLWIENDRKGRKPTTISTNRCAYILNKHLTFILFDSEENTKLAMYQVQEGIYTQNTTIIKRVISYLEPKHNSNKADEVIYHLINMVDIKEKTNSPYLIPVKNGVFNRKTKKLESFTPDYVFTTKIDTPYVKQDNVPALNGWNVEQWINDIACNDKQVVKLLWQVINDALNGNYTRKKAIFLVGDGNNGKGTFQELLSNIIGYGNIASLKVNEFDERFRLSTLEGKTAVIGDDVPVGVYVDDSSNFKSVVTGDPVLVEFKNKPLYRATFKCTVIQSTNGMPSFKDKTAGTLRRLLIVPFNANFNGTKENFKIKEDYVKNQRVLEYVLYKAINLDFETFDIPDVSETMLEVFKEDNDPVYGFKVNMFDQWTVRKVPKYIVYAFYKEYCDENGHNPYSSSKFYKQFESYLEDCWKTDAQRRYDTEELAKRIYNFNDNRNYIEPIESGKNYKSYENENLKAI
ncbi:phage/plasmid primase, P4 family [Staphylococcus edaphicus]|uniref:DNA primase n=1 Tax=Staphylococcus edaphicus TaxID=1955013 RepID=A0A2C6WKV5_9STAP|nr:phage/plasmid primase, P4 family [Staphylococcus edaphicus]PHK48783.1 DNA primase [Staphylococcus edaphicus]UQW81399.1 phage/plasmid primase, P4 family [Staphylococcus edaphicus]